MSGTAVATVAARRAGANMSVDVEIGGAWHNLCLPLSDVYRPRVDRIVCDGNTLQIITGAPTTGANLTNRFGMAALPADHMDVGRVLVHPCCPRVTDADVQAAWLDARIAEIERDIRGD